MEEKNLETIKQTAEDLLSRMGFSGTAEINAEEDGEESVTCNFKVTEDSNLLIGQYGVNLQSIQHILRLIIRKKISDKVKFIVDVNSYRKEKNQSLIELAHEAADQAVSEGRAIVLRPMSPYERRLIHLELSQNEKVVTESIGEDENRKIVVKPSKMKALDL